ncbi:MAG: hypothetical protein CMJ50_09335 [Planctomycetaceae bacterium]|jgi:hypothetical protein|nr:hypothetical protein [Planctomycetaceae bacterium]
MVSQNVDLRRHMAEDVHINCGCAWWHEAVWSKDSNDAKVFDNVAIAMCPRGYHSRPQLPLNTTN